MAEFGVTGGDLKKMIKAAKKAPVSFGFNPGKSDDEAYLGMHRTKSPPMLGKDAKEQGEGGKFTFGTATVAAKVISLTCLRDLPGLAKRMKKFLKSQKVMLNVVILDADGNVVESDIEDGLPDDPDLAEDGDDASADDAEARNVDPATGPTPVDVSSAADLLKRLAGLRDQIGHLGPEAQSKVAGPFRQLLDLVKTGELDRAAAGVEKLAAAIRMLAGQGATSATPAPPPPPPPPPDPQMLKLAQLLAVMRTQTEGLSDERTKAALLVALEKAAGLLRAQETEAVIALLKKVQDVLKSQPAAPVPETATSAAASDQSAAASDQFAADEPVDDPDASPSQVEWERRYAAIEGDVFVARSQGLVADVDELRRLDDYATGLAADRAWDKALAILQKIETMLTAGRRDGGSAFQAEVPADAKPFAEARLQWAQARARMHGEVGKIVAAIRAAAAEDALLDEAVANVSVLTDNVARLDDRLEYKLDQIVNAPADGRATLKDEARKLIDGYQAELADAFFQDIDQASGFGSVAVTSTARAALGAISRVLA